MKRMPVSGFTVDKVYFRKSPAFTRKIKAVVSLVLMLAIMFAQSSFIFGYEAHIVNVTAKICNYGEVRSIGYWKTHPEIYAYYLPQSLGGTIVDDEEKADEIFDFFGNARSATNKLMAQLLGMKFNIANFGIGDYIPEGDTRTLSQLIAEADGILSNPNSTKEEILAMKDLLDRLNNLELIKYCAGDLPQWNTHLVINKVYYDVDEKHGAEIDNEWVEIYNPTKKDIDISGFTIMDNYSDNIIASTYYIPAEGFVIVTANESTWNFWDIPAEVTKIVLEDGSIGNGLDDAADMLVLKDKEGNIIDQMNWGAPNLTWDNWNIDLWSPGALDVPEGHILGRKYLGFDMDKSTDFKDFGLPNVSLIIPNGGEVWWIGRKYLILWNAVNPNGLNSELLIDIWYSNDSGDTWAPIIKDTGNDGSYEWRVPLLLEGGYKTQSEKARIKVTARGPENFMIQAWDPSDKDFCPPIDYSLLTEEEKVLLEQLISDGVIIDDSAANNEEIVPNVSPVIEANNSPVQEEIGGSIINEVLPSDEIVIDSRSADNAKNASAYDSGNSEVGAGSEATEEESNISADNSQVLVPDSAASEEMPAETPVSDALQTETEPVSPTEETVPLVVENALEGVLPSEDTGIPVVSNNTEASPAEVPPVPDNSVSSEAEPLPVELAIDAEPGV